MALTIEIRQKKCGYLKKSTFLGGDGQLFIPEWYLGKQKKQDKVNADWQSVEYEEAKATTDGSEKPCLNDIQTE